MAARIIKRQDPGIPTSGTLVVGSPTGSTLPLNTNASSVSFANPSTSVTPTSSASAASTPSDAFIVQQPIPVRTLVAICVAAFILIGGLVIFVLWFGARKREKKFDSQIDYKGTGSGTMEDTTAETQEDVNLKGRYPPTNPNGGGMPKGLASEQSSYYSQSTGKGRNPYPIRRPATGDSVDQRQEQQPYTIPANYNSSYADTSFLPKQDVYTRNDMAPVSPVSPSSPTTRHPDMYNAQDPFSLSDPAPQSSPRSTSAQAILKPYNVGAHPYSSPHLRGSSIGGTSRTSIEHTGNYTTATALPEPEPIGLSASHYAPSPVGVIFAQAGARPGYDAYGIESSTRPTGYAQQAGRQPIQTLNARPSLESIRSIARKASIDRTAAEAATEFVMGGPQAVGTRSRNNSIGSSTRGRGAVSGGVPGSVAGPGYTSSVYSARSNKSTGGKEKLSKSEKKREMEAMDNLIAALDESATREKRRKDALAEAAGLASAQKGDESDASVSGRRRMDPAITGSYPLPPPDVFRAALGSAGRGRDSQVEDDLDDEEIERWRRH